MAGGSLMTPDMVRRTVPAPALSCWSWSAFQVRFIRKRPLSFRERELHAGSFPARHLELGIELSAERRNELKTQRFRRRDIESARQTNTVVFHGKTETAPFDPRELHPNAARTAVRESVLER